PLPDRGASRLLVLDRRTGRVEHRCFSDLGGYLDPGDALVLNDTRVIPARLEGRKESTGGRIEITLLREAAGDVTVAAVAAGPTSGRTPSPGSGRSEWEALVRPARRALPGRKFIFGEGNLVGEILPHGAGVSRGERRIVFSTPDGEDPRNVIRRLGKMPLPPYIKRDLDEPSRYQTVYARHEGSVAAPTAGLHFTERHLEDLSARGLSIAYVTLHVGPGTFLPVLVEDIDRHVMEAERFALEAETAGLLNEVRRRGNRTVAVGTTVTRVLESSVGADGFFKGGLGETGLFIHPGYRFRGVDCLLTNFHLPRSTLLMLVCAFAGTDRIRSVYREAVERRYRFYSLGDAMLIL
ncbi:MAG: tRNA preQ1(34) S-adenosylmethionine ribosyltransferase-isomerase QueA, partial [Firmicutes bacterium]|nr:tRNA preQ1(34) S-adenosylmethionine ribosyltransferase-isomerase QueA [Bacillota bacterium]